MAFGFSLDTGGLPILSNYKSALRHYNEVKPLRGSGDPGFRPLGENRKNKTVWIKLDAATGDVICGYHSTDVLRYCADGTLMLDNGGHQTMSTADFVAAVSPIDAGRAHGVIWYDAHTKDGIPKTLPLTGVTHFVQQEHAALGSRWTVLNPDYPVVHLVSRKGATTLRSKYAGFRRYLSAVAKVQTKGQGRNTSLFDRDALIELFGARSHTNTFGETAYYPKHPPQMTYMGRAQLVHEFLPLCEDEATFIKAHAWLWLSENNMLAAFDRVLMMAFPETYFTEETITTGKTVKDQYAKYNR